MNRHERRAAEAQTRSSFKDYDAVYRRAFKKAGDREIGEGWMRGAAAEASDIQGMILHLPHEPPPSRDECDFELSAEYGGQWFKAYTKATHLERLKEQWPMLVDALRNTAGSPVTGDMRHDARAFLFEMIVTNRHYETGGMASLTGGAIVWLATTAIPVSGLLGAKHIHYEITDTGPGTRNYRLMLM